MNTCYPMFSPAQRSYASFQFYIQYVSLQFCIQYVSFNSASNLHQMGPKTSDTHIIECIARIDEISAVLDQADEIFEKGIRAGAYYGLRGDVDEGMELADGLRVKLQEQHVRLMVCTFVRVYVCGFSNV